MLGGFKTQIVVLITLALVASAALYVGWDDNASPYAGGSEADKMWHYCKQKSGTSTRAYAKCTCPLEQTMRDVPSAMCLHVVMSMQRERAGRTGEVPKMPAQVLATLPKQCKEKVSAKDLADYEQILEACRLRYVGKE